MDGELTFSLVDRSYCGQMDCTGQPQTCDIEVILGL